MAPPIPLASISISSWSRTLRRAIFTGVHHLWRRLSGVWKSLLGLGDLRLGLLGLWGQPSCFAAVEAPGVPSSGPASLVSSSSSSL
jgi:hypothetical protein